MAINDVSSARPVAPPEPFGYTPQTGPSGGEVLAQLGQAALGIGSAFVPGLGGVEYATLIREQNRIQRENLMFSTMSNSSKAEHDTKKTIVSNWRAG